MTDRDTDLEQVHQRLLTVATWVADLADDHDRPRDMPAEMIAAGRWLIDLGERLAAIDEDRTGAPPNTGTQWTTAVIGDLPVPCWVERPGHGVWWCDGVRPIGQHVAELHLRRLGAETEWNVPPTSAVRYRTDPPQPLFPHQMPLDEARDYADRAADLLAREPADGEALDVRP